MGERRVASVLSQKTLGIEPTVEPPEALSEAPVPLPSRDMTPRPVLYPTVTASSVALHGRQLRWHRERDRRAAANPDPEG